MMMSQRGLDLGTLGAFARIDDSSIWNVIGEGLGGVVGKITHAVFGV